MQYICLDQSKQSPLTLTVFFPGDLCASFGFGLTFAGPSRLSSPRHPVCLPQRCLLGTLGEGDRADLDLWHVTGESYKATCYFWCTFSGHLPRAAQVNLTKAEEIRGQVRAGGPGT